MIDILTPARTSAHRFFGGLSRSAFLDSGFRVWNVLDASTLSHVALFTNSVPKRK